MKKIRLKNGEIGFSEGVFRGDLLIEGEKISKFLREDEKIDEEIEEIDCKGKLILPGFIDAHVHFREPGHTSKEDFETASSACVAGGITTVLDMPNNNPPIVSLEDLEKKRDIISGRSYVDYGFYIAFNGENVDEINRANVLAVKFYFANSTGKMGVSFGLKEFFEKSNKLIVVHAEDEDLIKQNEKKYFKELKKMDVEPSIHSEIRSVECASRAVEVLCKLALESKARLHIAHISTEDELNILEDYENITCEVSPHHLFLSEDDYEKWGNFLKINPPVRSREHLFAMWKGLKFGQIDMIATDHAPHLTSEKQKKYLDVPSGVPEVDTLMPLLLNAVNDEGLQIPELVNLCCNKPAEIFGIKNKGDLKEGYDADIVVVDMNLEKQVKKEDLRTKCGWSPYEGMKLKGWPIMTFVRGDLVFKDGEIVGEKKGKELN